MAWDDELGPVHLLGHMLAAQCQQGETWVGGGGGPGMHREVEWQPSYTRKEDMPRGGGIAGRELASHAQSLAFEPQKN